MAAATGRSAGHLAALAFALALGGCAAPRACYCRDSAPNTVVAGYAVACPDVLELTIGPRPDLTGRATVEPDGTIPLGSSGRARVDGLTAEEIADRLTSGLGISRSQVQVRVAEFASRQLFLCGPVAGHERAIPYEGPETVVDFLRRTGGLSRDAEPRDVQIVRANVAVGRRPEVFPVDLKAILTRGDEATNVQLQPYDQVYVGETTRAAWAKYLPPWMHVRQAPGSEDSTRGFIPAPSGLKTPPGVHE
jgi:protein involved in polysaccharide export with SLBB domain